MNSNDERMNDELSQLLAVGDELCETLSELIKQAKKGEAGASEFLKVVVSHMQQASEVHLAAISSTQSLPIYCRLPKHTHTLGFWWYRCETNQAEHLFCRRHWLDKCVLCGGTLK